MFVLKRILWLCFSFKGRIHRKAFWVYGVLSTIFVVLVIEGSKLLLDVFPNVVFLTVALLFIKVFITDWAIIVKRLHDVGLPGRYGYWVSWFLFPFGTLYMFYICGLYESEDEENEYGPPPG